MPFLPDGLAVLAPAPGELVSRKPASDVNIISSQMDGKFMSALCSRASSPKALQPAFEVVSAPPGYHIASFAMGISDECEKARNAGSRSYMVWYISLGMMPERVGMSCRGCELFYGHGSAGTGLEADDLFHLES